MTKSLTVLATCGLCALVAATAGAQSLSRSGMLTGTVRDVTSAVLRDATVVIRGDYLIGGDHTVVVDAAGRYRLMDLPPGGYTLTVSRPGFTTGRREGIDLPAGGTIVVDFTLRVGNVVDTVDVEAPSPMVDVTSAATNQNISAALLRDLPTNRVVSNLVNLAPGVLNEVAFGGSRLGNALSVDGVDMTEDGVQDPWLRLSQNWLQEVQVASLGAGAAEGGFTGVSAHYVLRSGSNRWAGLGEVHFTQPSWVGKNTGKLSSGQQASFAPRRIDQGWDVSAQAGFPIVQDRLWLFTGLQHTVLDDRPFNYSGNLNTQSDETLFLAKATAALSHGVRLDGFVQTGRNRVEGVNLSSRVLDSALADWDRPQLSGNLGVTWPLANTTLIEARYHGSDLPLSFLPRPPNTCDGPPAHFDRQNGQQSGNVVQGCTRASNLRHELALSASHYTAGYLGRHGFKAGVEIERTNRRVEQSIPAGIVYHDFGGAPNQALLWEGQSSTTDVTRFSAHVEDHWQINTRLTLVPGLRVDVGDAGVPMVPGIVSAAIWSPRLGVAFDATPDHRTVLRAHYGRYYDPVFSSPIAGADYSDWSPEITVRIIPPDRIEEINRTSLAENFTIDPAIRNGYVDQFVVGGERHVWSNTSVLVQYIRRRFDDFNVVIDTGSQWAPVSVLDSGPDNVAGTADDGGDITAYNLLNPNNAQYLLTNPEEAFRQYDALQFVVRQRDSKYGQAQVSYTWSKSEGNVGNGAHVNAGLNETGTGAFWTDPNRLINLDGRSPFDPTHEFKVLGTARLPWWGDFSASAAYRYATGGSWAREIMVGGLNQGQARVRVEPRGTRRLEATSILDLRLEQVWRIAQTGRIGVYFDVFNATNRGVTTMMNPVSGRFFGTPNSWSDPRTIYAGLRYSF